MPKSSWSLAFRLTAWYTAASLLLLLAATGTLYWALVTNLERSSALFLADKVHVVSTLLQERPDDSDGLREEVELESAARRFEHFYIRLLDEQNRTLMETPMMERFLPARLFSGLTDGGGRIESVGGGLFEAVVAEAPLGDPPRGRRYLQIALDLSRQREILASCREWLWAIVLASFVLCPLVGYQIARQGLRPVQCVVETAKRIGSSTLSERIQAEGYPADLADLAVTFNAMLDRLEDGFDRLTRFSGDLAHELRTPVNNIRGEIEVALARTRHEHEYREVLESNLEEVVRLAELIGSLLFLARTESPGAHLDRQTVDVGELLETIREYYEGSAEEAGVTLGVDAPPGARATLDRSLIQRAVGNLVSNALAHTREGGTVTLSANRVSGKLDIRVTDSGSGIPAESIPRVFDRFYRVDQARSQSSGGSGLGLSIVQGIVTLHKGKVRIASEPGKGTEVTLSIPDFD
jgi:two-component system heavy metal sensor histidine kinase CusS